MLLYCYKITIIIYLFLFSFKSFAGNNDWTITPFDPPVTSTCSFVLTNDKEEILMGGGFHSPLGLNGIYIFKLDSTGNKLFLTQIPGLIESNLKAVESQNEMFLTAEVDWETFDEIDIGSFHLGQNKSTTTTLLINLENNGGIRWIKRYDDCKLGNLLPSGQGVYFTSGNNETSIIQVDADGKVIKDIKLGQTNILDLNSDGNENLYLIAQSVAGKVLYLLDRKGEFKDSIRIHFSSVSSLNIENSGSTYLIYDSSWKLWKVDEELRSTEIFDFAIDQKPWIINESENFYSLESFPPSLRIFHFDGSLFNEFRSIEEPLLSDIKCFSPCGSRLIFGLVTNGNAMVVSIGKSIETAGLEEFQSSDHMLYPNPSDTKIYLDPGAGNLNIYDLSGKKILLEPIPPNEYNTSELEPGFYIYTYSKDGVLVSGCLVIQH